MSFHPKPMAKVKDTDQERLLTRRAFVLGGMQMGLFGVLGWRLYDLQVRQGERYRTLAEENRISTRILLPHRGLVYDRRKVVMARNEQNFRAELALDQVQDPRDTLRKLYGYLPFEDFERARIEKDIRRKSAQTSVLLRDNLTWDELALLELRTPELPGVAIVSGEVRSYPDGVSTAHILGYTGAPTEKEAGNDPLLNNPGMRIGKGGVEKIYDLELRGTPGAEQLEVNVHGQPVRELARRAGTRGHDVTLTIDMELQNYVQKRLSGERSASAVILDAQTGAVYAFASYPSFDANLFTRGISRTDYKRLNTDSDKPLLNKALMGMYAPGSTFKTVVALAAQESGISPSTRFYCPGHMDLGNNRFHCWKKGGHGTVDMLHAITQSCDVYFYHLGQKIGIDTIAKYARMMGLGTPTGIDLPHEKGGLVPDREWKKKRFKQNWGPGETLIASIGQGYMLATTLQLAVMSARIANGGRAVVPHVMKSVEDVKRATETFPSLPIDPAHLDLVRRGMAGVCAAGGTAYSARIEAAGYEMAGKTGTSQVRRISKAERAKGVIPNEKRPWDERDHALFVAFAPVNAPRYAAAVIVEHGGGGGKVAGPIARDILMYTQHLDPAGVLPVPLSLLPADAQAPANTPSGANSPDNSPDNVDDMLPDQDMAPDDMPDDEGDGVE